MLIGVPAETAPGETRVAVTAETAKKLVAQGHTMRIQSGAGVAAVGRCPARGISWTGLTFDHGWVSSTPSCMAGDGESAAIRRPRLVVEAGRRIKVALW